MRSTFFGTSAGQLVGIDPLTGKGFEAMFSDIVIVTDGLNSSIDCLEYRAGVIARLMAE